VRIPEGESPTDGVVTIDTAVGLASGADCNAVL